MIWLLAAVVITFLCVSHVQSDDYEYSDMSCAMDSSYRNVWDGSHDAYTISQDGEYLMMNGQHSTHDDDSEDRRFKWNFCGPEQGTDGLFDSKSWLSATSYDSAWSKSCGGTGALIRAISSHSNKKEDRVWSFYCGQLSSTYKLADCSWSGYANSWDNDVNYYCSSNGVLNGIYSTHDNGKEDRMWKFLCCRLQHVITYPDTTCVYDEDFVDYWSEETDTSTDAPKYALSGQSSFHDADGNVQLRWNYCQVLDDADAIVQYESLETTDEDDEWRARCDHLNDGDAVMMGDQTETDAGVAKHHTFECGELDTSKYRLLSCEETSQDEATDEVVAFECVDDGVIRQIWLEHSTDTRVWRFECCRIADVVQSSFGGNSNPLGFTIEFTTENMVYGIGVLLCAFLVVNVVLYIHWWYSKRRNQPHYKVVSMQSTDDEAAQLNA